MLRSTRPTASTPRSVSCCAWLGMVRPARSWRPTRPAAPAARTGGSRRRPGVGGAAPLGATDRAGLGAAGGAGGRPAVPRGGPTIEVRDPNPPWALASPAGAAHAIDVLLDNALRHG